MCSVGVGVSVSVSVGVSAVWVCLWVGVCANM